MHRAPIRRLGSEACVSKGHSLVLRLFHEWFVFRDVYITFVESGSDCETRSNGVARRQKHQVGRGKWGLVSCEKIAAGQPFVCVEKDKNRCARCGAQRSAEMKMKACAGCKTVLYCSKQCQAEDWEGHKGRCRRLSQAASSAPKAAQQVAASPPSDE